MFKFLRRLFRVVKIRWRVRQLRKAWKTIRLTDALMADKPSWKRQQFYHDFIYHHDFRRFAAKKFMEDIL